MKAKAEAKGKPQTVQLKPKVTRHDCRDVTTMKS